MSPRSLPAPRPGVDLRPGTTRIALTHHGPAAATLEVAGEVDLCSVDLVADTLLAAVDLSGCSELAVDLGDVSFLGAAGIGVLAQAHDRAAARGTRIRLVRTSRIARRALEAAGSTGCFDDGPSRAALEPAGAEYRAGT